MKRIDCRSGFLASASSFAAARGGDTPCGCSPTCRAEARPTGAPAPITGPLLATPVPAGFPSPADDYVEGRIDLNRHLIAHREATFFIRVTGDSMTGFGIHDGDLLVVDRAVEASDRSIVIAVLEGDFTVKQLCHTPEGSLLRAGNADYPDIRIGAEQALTIWGVVRWSIHEVGICRQA